MRRIPITLASSAALALALTGCYTDSFIEPEEVATTPADDTDEDDTPAAEEDTDDAADEDEDTSDQDDADDEDVPFETPDALATYLEQSHDDVDVYLNPDSGDLSVKTASTGMRNSDQVYTAETLELIGHNATFDYDTVTITGSTDAGIWAYRYDKPTIDGFVERGIIIPNVWDHAENSTDNVH